MSVSVEFKSLPVEVRRTASALKGIQVSQQAIQRQYELERLVLEKKYHERRQPLFDRREAIINGRTKPSPSEIETGEKQLVKEDDQYPPLPKDPRNTTAPIPEFWLKTLRNHVNISDLIADSDIDALKHLVDIRLSYPPNAGPKPDFKLSFIFSPSRYFDNRVLEKTYFYGDEMDEFGSFGYLSSTGTKIMWKRDGCGNTTPSFFNFFTPPAPMVADNRGTGGVQSNDDHDDDLVDDFELGEDFRDDIICSAVDYFTGGALPSDNWDDIDADIIEDDDEEDENDSDDDEDDEDHDDGEGDSDSENDRY